MFDKDVQKLFKFAKRKKKKKKKKKNLAPSSVLLETYQLSLKIQSGRGNVFKYM